MKSHRQNLASDVLCFCERSDKDLLKHPEPFVKPYRRSGIDSSREELAHNYTWSQKEDVAHADSRRKNVGDRTAKGKSQDKDVDKRLNEHRC